MKIPVHNNTKMPMYVAGLMIPAGETRHFEENQVPSHLRPAPVADAVDAPADPLVELLDHKVADVAAALAELSDADLETLGSMEQAAENPRKGVLHAIAEETLRRADAAQGGAQQ